MEFFATIKVQKCCTFLQPPILYSTNQGLMQRLMKPLTMGPNEDRQQCSPSNKSRNIMQITHFFALPTTQDQLRTAAGKINK